MPTTSSDADTLMRLLGFKTPTAIQVIAIPKIVSHELDTIIVAPTGSGKTEAAVVPLIHKLVKNGLNEPKGIKIIYITPLRALNRDILRRLSKIAHRYKLAVAIWHGDTPSSARKRVLIEPPDILITTPESLQILLAKESLRKNLKHLYAVVVDEVQELISSERGTELAVTLERIDHIIGRHARRILISSPIGNVDAIAQYFFSSRRYDVAHVKGLKKYQIKVAIAYDDYRNGVFDEERIYDFLCKNTKFNEGSRQVLVFANTRTMAEELGYRLSKCLGNNIALHHSSLSKELRESVEAMFKQGDLRVVVATSSLELGIDIGGVDLVLQYLSPRQALKLIQRVGRAGHQELKESRGVIVVPPIITELIEAIVIAKRARNGVLEIPKYHVKALDVLAHQVVGLTLDYGEISLDKMWRIISSATPFSSMMLSELEAVVNFMNSIGLIKCENDLCRSTKRGLIYYLTVNMIPEPSYYIAKSIIDGRIVGQLDEGFALACTNDDILVLAGRLWNVVSVDVDRREVLLAPVDASELVVLPKWVGELIPVHENVAREVCAFMRRFCNANGSDYLARLFEEYDVDESTRNFLTKNRERLCAIYPRDNALVIEMLRIADKGKTLIAFYTCLGSRASEAFSVLLGHVFRSLLGTTIAYKSHQLGTVILANTVVDKSVPLHIIKRLRHLATQKELVRGIIENELKNTTLFKQRLVFVARRLGIIGKNVPLSEAKRIIDGLMNIDVVVQEALRELLTEKIDVDRLLLYLDELHRGRKPIKVFIRSTASPYLEEISSLSVFRSLIRYSLMPKDVMVEIVKRRLLDKEVKMFCISCYHTWTMRISKDLEKCKDIFSCSIECPRCCSKAITIIDSNSEVPMIIRALNKVRGRLTEKRTKLLANEKEVLEKHKKIVDFLMSHGMAGIIALQGIGVGIETAKRVIARSSDLNSLILNIIEQEETYLRTSKYWRK